MALLFWDGWDSYNTMTEISAANPSVDPFYAWSFRNAPQFSTTGGRFDGGYFINGEFGVGQIYLSNNPTEIYYGKAVKLSGAGEYPMHIFENNQTGWTPAITVQTTGVGQIQAWRGKASPTNGGSDMGKVQIGLSDSNVLSYGSWHWLEVRAKMSSDSATDDGIFEMWLDNIKIISNTACVTKYSNTSTYYSGVGLWVEAGVMAGGTRTDDIYVTDPTGDAPWNTRLGDVRMVTVSVNGDAGPSQGTPSTGNTNFGVVDETKPDTSDWLAFDAANANTGAMFSHAGLPSTNNFGILATAVRVFAGKTDSGNANFKISIQSSARANSNTIALSTTNTYFRQEWTTDPATGLQWSNTAWHSCNVGVFVV